MFKTRRSDPASIKLKRSPSNKTSRPYVLRQCTYWNAEFIYLFKYPRVVVSIRYICWKQKCRLWEHLGGIALLSKQLYTFDESDTLGIVSIITYHITTAVACQCFKYHICCYLHQTLTSMFLCTKSINCQHLY